MKKKILMILILGMFLGGISVNAYYGLVNDNADNLANPKYYVGGYEEVGLATIDYSSIDTIEGYDYDVEVSISFNCDIYSEYLLLPESGGSIGFFNENYGDNYYNVHYDYEEINATIHYRLNETVSFVSEDNGEFMIKGESYYLDEWCSLLNSQNGLYSYNNKSYSIADSIVLQSRNVEEVSFNALSTGDSYSILVLKLHDQSLQNKTYQNKDVYVITSATNPITITKLLSYITVEDNCDTDVQNTLKVVDYNYEVIDSKIALGTYYITLSAKDSSGNLTKQNIFIRVSDLEKPVVTGTNIFAAKYSQKLDILACVKKYLTATDNIDGEIDDWYIIDSSEYDENWNKLGQYSVEVGIKDSSGNEAVVTLRITVRDNDYPVIEAIKTLSQEIGTDLLTEQEIIDCFSIYDQYDKDNVVVSLDGYSNYESNYNVLGKYPMSLTVTDQTGNMTVKKFDWVVMDNEKPTINIVDGIITIIIPEGTILTEDDVRNLVAAQELSNEEIVSVSSLYFDEENPSGEYELMVTYADGSVSNLKLSVEASYGESSNQLFIIIALGVVLALIFGKIFLDMKKKKKNAQIIDN